MKTNPSETIVQSAENAIMNAARALIGVVRRVERNEKHRATKTELEIDVELLAGGHEIWTITIERTSSSH